MGDLPRGKNGLILWVTYPGKKKMENGLILMGDLPRKNGGLIVMGDLPKWTDSNNVRSC